VSVGIEKRKGGKMSLHPISTANVTIEVKGDGEIVVTSRAPDYRSGRLSPRRFLVMRVANGATVLLTEREIEDERKNLERWEHRGFNRVELLKLFLRP